MRFITVFLLVTPLWSYGADFKANLPSWKMSKNADVSIYVQPKNSKEIIVTRSWIEKSPEQAALTEGNLAGISQARSWILSKFGIGGYTILHLERKKTAFNGFQAYDEIQAAYTGLNGQTHQMIERQYTFDNKIYQVVYSVQALAINDHDRVDAMLDQLRPLPPPRTPASAKEVAKAGHVVTCSNCSSVAADSEQLKSYDMSSPVAQNICRNVPIKQRRTPQDPIWEQVNVFADGAYCAKGVAENAWGILKGLGQLGVSYWKYALSPQYHSQVNASAALIYGEVKKDPKAFSQKVLASAFNAVGKAWDQFPCYKPQVQAEIVCKVASNLIPAGLMGKVLTGAKLTAEEAATVAKMTEVAATDVKAMKVVEETEIAKSAPALALKKGEDLQNELADFASRQIGKVDRTDRVADFIAEKMKNEGYSLEVLKGDEGGLSSYHLVKKTPEGEIEAEIPAMVDKRRDFVPMEAKRIINSLKQRHGLTEIPSGFKDAETYKLKATEL